MTALAPALPLSRPAPRPLVAAGMLPLLAFAAAALGAGIGRAVTTTYLPLLLERIKDAPGLIGMVMLVNAFAGFGIPLVVGLWSDRSPGRGAPHRLHPRRRRWSPAAGSPPSRSARARRTSSSPRPAPSSTSA